MIKNIQTWHIQVIICNEKYKKYSTSNEIWEKQLQQIKT